MRAPVATTTGVMIGSDVRGVAEIYPGPLFFRHFLDSRIILLVPLLDQSLVAFERALQWCLDR